MDILDNLMYCHIIISVNRKPTVCSAGSGATCPAKNWRATVNVADLALQTLEKLAADRAHQQLMGCHSTMLHKPVEKAIRKSSRHRFSHVRTRPISQVLCAHCRNHSTFRCLLPDKMTE